MRVLFDNGTSVRAAGAAARTRAEWDSIIFRFLDHPSERPDASCIAAMPRVAFETNWLETPMLFFTIAGQNSPFTGKWDAVAPNLPRAFRFDLTITASGKLTGTINAGPAACRGLRPAQHAEV